MYRTLFPSDIFANLVRLQREFGYARTRGDEPPGEHWTIPTFQQVAAFAQATPSLTAMALATSPAA